MSYVTTCSICGGDLFVVGFKADTRIPLCSDGFSTLDATYFDTEDEVVECGGCGVRGALSTKEAKPTMLAKLRTYDREVIVDERRIQVDEDHDWSLGPYQDSVHAVVGSNQSVVPWDDSSDPYVLDRLIEYLREDIPAAGERFLDDNQCVSALLAVDVIFNLREKLKRAQVELFNYANGYANDNDWKGPKDNESKSH